MEEAREQGSTSEYGVIQEQMLTFTGNIYIPNRVDLKEVIMNEYHRSNYAGHPGYQKMLMPVTKFYFWPDMRRNIIEYLNKCFECQHVKVEHRHLARLLQPIHVPEWKWEVISIDLITGFPR